MRVAADPVRMASCARGGKAHKLRCKIQVVCCSMCTGEWELNSKETVQCERKNYQELAQTHKRTPVEANIKGRLREESTIVRASGSSAYTCIFLALSGEETLGAFL